MVQTLATLLLVYKKYNKKIMFVGRAIQKKSRFEKTLPKKLPGYALRHLLSNSSRVRWESNQRYHKLVGDHNDSSQVSTPEAIIIYRAFWQLQQRIRQHDIIQISKSTRIFY